MQPKKHDIAQRDDVMKLLINIEGRLSRLEARLEALEKEVVDLKVEFKRRNGYMLYTIIILIIILSFISAMFGLGWRPP